MGCLDAPRHASRRRLRAGFFLGLAVALVAACEQETADDAVATQPAIPVTDATEPQPAYPQAPPLPPESIPARPQQVQDTIMLEGMPEPTRARLVEAPADFPIRFSTYVPDGIGSEFEGRGDSASVRFYAAFGGAIDRNAYMHVRLYPAAVSRTAAVQAATDFVRSRAPWRDESAPADAPPWGLAAFTYQYRGDGDVPYTGRVVVGHHADRYFHVLTHYPAEYGDGLGPRFERILRHWRWEDTGRPLVQR